MAVPMIPDSASGVSITRMSPYLAWRPSVTRKTPPFTPTSSPMTSTVGSFAISWSSPRLIAWTMFILGIGGVLLQVLQELCALFLAHRVGRPEGVVEAGVGLEAFHALELDHP